MNRTHGLASTYNNGGCRCELCKAAVAAYRRSRRSRGFDLKKKSRKTVTDPRIDR